MQAPCTSGCDGDVTVDGSGIDSRRIALSHSLFTSEPDRCADRRPFDGAVVGPQHKTFGRGDHILRAGRADGAAGGVGVRSRNALEATLRDSDVSGRSITGLDKAFRRSEPVTRWPQRSLNPRWVADCGCG